MFLERLEEVFDEELFIENMSIPVKRKKYNKFFKAFVSEKEVVVKVPYLVTGNGGIYVFIEDITDASQIRSYLLHKFKMRESIFVFAETEDGGTYYDDTKNEYIDFEDFYNGLAVFRQNHMIPECWKHKYKFACAEEYFNDVYEPLEDEEDEDSLYVRPLVSNSKLEEIDEIIVNLEDEPVTEGKYIYYPDGSMRVKKFVSRGFMNGSECSYPCADESSNKLYWCTAFLGWIGFHKFYHKKIGQGLLYLISCGLFGILPIFDLMSMLFGDYYYTDVNYDMGANRKISKSSQRIYLRPLEKKWLCVLGIFASMVITYLAFNFMYQPVVSALGDILATLSENFIDVNSGDIQGIVDSLPVQ